MPRATVAQSSKLLKLADNPFMDDADEDDLDDESMGDDMDGMDYDDEDEDYPDDDEEDFEDEEYPDDDEEEDEAPMMAPQMSMARKAQANKGRRVSGPRTKLSKRIDGIEIALARGAAVNKSLANAAKTQSEALIAILAKMDDFDSDFTPYGPGDDSDEEYHEDDEEGTKNDPGLSMARKGRVAKSSRGSRVMKDDAASSYGEKDDDIVGNRELVPDDKGLDAERTLIQGGPGDGPGPVSKSAQQAAALVISELRKAGILPSAVAKSARSPNVGTSVLGSQVNKGEDVVRYMTVVKQGRAVEVPVFAPAIAKDSNGADIGLGYGQISRIREDLHELPSDGLFN